MRQVFTLVAKTMTVADPKRQYPAATIFLPGCKISEISGFPTDFFSNTPKMEPIDAKHSIFEDPSTGSKQTMYFPACFSSTLKRKIYLSYKKIECHFTIIKSLFSSETNTQQVKDEVSILMNRSLAKTSNFLTFSP